MLEYCINTNGRACARSPYITDDTQTVLFALVNSLDPTTAIP
jgi:hypothetical protein